uniref:Uncharacterized protein n=1 Tax=Arundo donax TaxID=35708 RepID=A0A0A9DL60_ARUDO
MEFGWKNCSYTRKITIPNRQMEMLILELWYEGVMLQHLLLTYHHQLARLNCRLELKGWLQVTLNLSTGLSSLQITLIILIS